MPPRIIYHPLIVVFVSLMMVGYLPILLVAAGPTDRDSPGPVQPFPSSGTASGQLNITPDHSDLYYKDLVGGEIIVLTISNSIQSIGNISLKMSMPNSTLELRTPTILSGKVHVLNFVSNETITGRSIINVSLVSGTTANYTVGASFKTQNDGGLGKDAAGSSCCGISLTGMELSIIGEVGPGDEVLGIDKNDLYYFQVPPHHEIILNGTSNSSKTDTWVELHDGAVKVLPYFRGLLIKTSPLDVKVYGGDSGGTFYINIDWENGPQATYHIDLTVREAPDTTAPKLTVDTVPGVVMSKMIEVTGNVSDDRAVDHVEVSINSGPSTLCNGVSAWKCQVSLFEGQNIVVITGFDSANNKASKTLTINRAFQPSGPMGIDIVIIEPGQGASVDKETIDINGRMNRTEPQAVVSCSVDGGTTWSQGEIINGVDWRCLKVPLNKKENTALVKMVASDGSQDQASVTIYRNMPEEEQQGMGTPQIALAILVLSLIIVVMIIAIESRDLWKKEKNAPLKIPRNDEEE